VNSEATTKNGVGRSSSVMFLCVLVLPAWLLRTHGQYDADIEWLRTSFSSYGDVKEFFDLISKRGLIFVTYVSLSSDQQH
jgi:hypothetical protein